MRIISTTASGRESVQCCCFLKLNRKFQTNVSAYVEASPSVTASAFRRPDFGARQAGKLARSPQPAFHGCLRRERKAGPTNRGSVRADALGLSHRLPEHAHRSQCTNRCNRGKG